MKSADATAEVFVTDSRHCNATSRAPSGRPARDCLSLAQPQDGVAGMSPLEMEVGTNLRRPASELRACQDGRCADGSDPVTAAPRISAPDGAEATPTTISK